MNSENFTVNCCFIGLSVDGLTTNQNKRSGVDDTVAPPMLTLVARGLRFSPCVSGGVLNV